VDAFLQELQSSGAGDLNAVFATLNESGLCREALAYWIARRWVAVAPHSPLLALRGDELHHGIGLQEFCGAPTPLEEEAGPSAAGPAVKEETRRHEDS
jgi:hypothetical protein